MIDEFRLDLHPYVAGEGTRLFDDVRKSYRLDLVSSTEFSTRTVGLHWPPAPLNRRPGGARARIDALGRRAAALRRRGSRYVTPALKVLGD